MSYSVPRSLVAAFYKAYAARDHDTVADFLDDDVNWTISGPVDLLRFCGTRRGKDAALDMMARVVPQVFRIFSFVHEAILIDGDRVASLNRLSASLGERVVSYRLAHHLRFRDGKVVEMLSLIDSFDAVQQVLGRPLTASDRVAAGEGDLIAV
jgi:ketosteroid isomerase-like protein